MLIDLRAEARPFQPELPFVPAAPDIHAAAIAAWRGRMKNEHGSRRVFAELASQVARAGLPGADACHGFAEEERTHGVLCGAVVEALGGEAVFEEPQGTPVPDHEDVPCVEGVLRNLVSVSCLSETVAVALISAERLEMTAGPLRDLLERILADEIGHARFGWKLVSEEVPRLDRAARERLSRYLAVAFAELERHELAHIAPGRRPSAESALLGLCEGPASRRLFQSTVDEVIVPRLTELGLAADWAWHARRSVPR